MSPLLAALLVLTEPGGSREPSLTMSNGLVQVTVTGVNGSRRAGSVTQLLDLATGIDLTCGKEFASIHCGPFVPVDGSLTLVSPTEALFQSTSMRALPSTETIPVALQVRYRLVGRGVEIEIGMTAQGVTELESTFDADFYAEAFNTLTFRNQTATDRVVQLSTGSGSLRISSDQVVELARNDGLLEASMVFPNPAWSVLALNNQPEPCDKYLSLRLFDWEHPREMATGPILHSTLPAGYSRKFLVSLSLDPSFCPVFLSDHPDGLERSAAWMMDDIPFRHPPDTTLWCFSTTSSGGEYITAWMIELMEEHPDLRMNWLILPDAILGPNCDSMWAEQGFEESWSHWHCTWRIATLAPQAYLQWLVNIQDDVYPWADRVTLGNHGYHHTPSPDSAWDPFHEFILYQPAEHMERFEVVRQDLDAMGLDTAQVRVIRYPGHRTSLSGLMAVIKYGYDFYCNGIRWYESMGGQPFWDQYLSHYVSPYGEIWGSNTVWWADYQMMYNCSYLSTVMNRGKFGLLGAHPVNMWNGGNPAAYARMDSLCSSLEEDYPNFGWLLPEEYADFLHETALIHFDYIHTQPAGITAGFTGQATLGQTMVAFLPTPQPTILGVTVDGQPAAWLVRPGGRLFCTLPGLTGGTHVFEAEFSTVGAGGGHDEPLPGAVLSGGSPFSGDAVLTASGLVPGTPVELAVYDLAGRRALDLDLIPEGSTETIIIPMDGMPSGVYIFRLDAPGAGALRLIRLN